MHANDLPAYGLLTGTQVPPAAHGLGMQAFDNLLVVVAG
jgi:hypothetical protein